MSNPDVSVNKVTSALVVPVASTLGDCPRVDNPNRIAEWRAARRLSQARLAAIAGTTDSQINKLEKGQRRLTDAWMRRLALALEISPADLLLEAEAPRVYGTGPLPSTDGELDQSPEELLVTALDLHRRGLRTRAAAHARAYVEIVEQEDGPTRRRRRTA